MSEYVATEDEGTRPVRGEPGSADDASATDKTMQPVQAGQQGVGDVARTGDIAEQAKSSAQDVRQPLEQSPACERRR